MRMAVDEAGDDRRTRCVDAFGAGRIGDAVIRSHVRDATVAHEQRDAEA